MVPSLTNSDGMACATEVASEQVLLLGLTFSGMFNIRTQLQIHEGDSD